MQRPGPAIVVGTFSTAKVDFRRAYTSPTLLLMGNETPGPFASLVGGLQYPGANSHEGRVESLNLATATALMLYEIVKP